MYQQIKQFGKSNAMQLIPCRPCCVKTKKIVKNVEHRISRCVNVISQTIIRQVDIIRHTLMARQR